MTDKSVKTLYLYQQNICRSDWYVMVTITKSEMLHFLDSLDIIISYHANVFSPTTSQFYEAMKDIGRVFSSPSITLMSFTVTLIWVPPK